MKLRIKYTSAVLGSTTGTLQEGLRQVHSIDKMRMRLL